MSWLAKFAPVSTELPGKTNEWRVGPIGNNHYVVPYRIISKLHWQCKSAANTYPLNFFMIAYSQPLSIDLNIATSKI